MQAGRQEAVVAKADKVLSGQKKLSPAAQRAKPAGTSPGKAAPAPKVARSSSFAKRFTHHLRLARRCRRRCTQGRVGTSRG